MFRQWTRGIESEMKSLTDQQLADMAPVQGVKGGDKIVMTELPEEGRRFYCLLKVRMAEVIRHAAELALHTDPDKLEEIELESRLQRSELGLLQTIFNQLLRRVCNEEMKRQGIPREKTLTIEIVKGWQVVTRQKSEQDAMMEQLRRFGVPPEFLSELEEDPEHMFAGHRR